MANVLMDKVLKPEEFLWCVTGKRFKLPRGANPITWIHMNLIEEGFEDDDCNTIWDYCLSDINEIGEHDDIVLVDVSRIDIVGQCTIEYRWFEVPDNTESRFDMITLNSMPRYKNVKDNN